MITISKLTIQDIKQIVLLEETVLQETLGEEMLVSEINNPAASFYVAKDDLSVIGYIGGYFVLNIGEIINFAVYEKYQRCGIGSKLFFALIKDYPELKEITLEVKETNIKGKSFYLKHGFKPISVRKNYYRDGTNAIVMMKVIR